MTSGIIKLSGIEMSMAAHVGAMRRIRSTTDGLDKNKHAAVSDWATDVEGAAYEMVVAKFLGVYWSGSINSFKASDLDNQIQVRGSKHSNGYLIVRHNDPAEHLFVFVTGQNGTYKIHGCMRGAFAKKEEYYRDSSIDGAAAWWVPQDHLVRLEK